MQILIKIRVCDCTVVARTSSDCCNSVRYVSEIIRTNCRKIIKLPNDLFIFATCCVIFLLLLSIITRIAHVASVLKRCSVPVADLGGCGRTPLASFREILGPPISKIVRTADSTIIKFIITNFYLAASSHEIFLRVGGREGMKGLGALQRQPLPHPPCKNPGPATARTVCLSHGAAAKCNVRRHDSRAA